jgi:hypothetical protein
LSDLLKQRVHDADEVHLNEDHAALAQASIPTKGDFNLVSDWYVEFFLRMVYDEK